MVISWLWANLTGIGVLVSMVTGVAGLVISIWTRVDQRHEAKSSRRQREPYFTAQLNPHPDDEGWRMLKLTFFSPAGIGFEMDTVKIRQPRGATLAPRLKGPHGESTRDTSTMQRKLSVVWRVDAPQDAAKAASQTMLFCRIDSPDKPFVIQIAAREVSGTQRSFLMETKSALAKPASP